MRRQDHCERERRRRLVRELGLANGIDFLEVLDREALEIGSPRQRTLLVRCLQPLAASVTGENVEIAGGVRITSIVVEWAGRASDAAALEADGLITTPERHLLEDLPEPDQVLVVRVDQAGDFSLYRLDLVSGDGPLDGFDPQLAGVDFWFKVECPTDFDCAAPAVCPPAPEATPPIDYLARDYASLRRVLLDRLAVVVPDWADRSPADLGVTIAEVLAHAADHLSYFQDAVATEATLETARRRPSVRRHARLLDYFMHDGCNARTWVAVTAEAGVVNVVLPREFLPGQPTLLLSQVPGRTTEISLSDVDDIVAQHAPAVFEPLQEIRLFAAHNTIRIHTWGDQECCLPRGATRATLVDDLANRLRLRAGDVLILAEARGPHTGEVADADPARRHAVRLTRVVPEAEVDDDGMRTAAEPPRLDEAFAPAVPVVEIEWDEADALPLPLCLSALIDVDGEDVLIEDVSVAHGNVLLADHGRTIGPEVLAFPTTGRWYRPQLAEADVTQAAPLAEADATSAAAAAVVVQDPRAALPAVTLTDAEGVGWTARRDLLAADRFDTVFVVETENDGRATLRFGDGEFGLAPEPGVPLTAVYRIGGGEAGNVGAEAIAHVVTTPGLGIEAVRNPLPAIGGVRPESLAEVRLYAPQAFRRQERAVTEADYAEMAERHPQVSRAVARRRWTGSWHTMFVAVDRVGGRPVDDAFEAVASAHLARYQMANRDVEIAPPVFVPLDLALKVCVKPGYLRADVHRALLDVFANHDLPGGGRGFFHPDLWTFDQPVYLSRIVAAAMQVAGVRWVEVTRLQRWRDVPHGEIEAGGLDIGRFEVARLDNDPSRPENGRLEFILEGGL